MLAGTTMTRVTVQPTKIITLLVDYNLVHKGVSDDWGVD